MLENLLNEQDLAPGGQGTTDGRSNLTVDFGFFTSVSVGDKVWVDLDGNGLQNGGEPGVPGVTVRIYNATTGAEITTDMYGNPLLPEVTDANGEYLFENLHPGSYYVIFDLNTVPPYYTVTIQNVDGNVSNEDDSDASPVNGLTENTGYIPSGGANLSLDMGLQCNIEVDAGQTAKICSKNMLALAQLNAFITPASVGGVWSTSGDGQFVQGDGTTIDNTFSGAVFYIPGPNDKTNGSVTLTLTSNPIGPCLPVSDTVVITVLKVDCGAFPWDGN
ncbi:MAG: hypothetical protein IPL49_17160 [Saprospirales bacterium]|nr:hypothetical protein [Saprospirales bacterium]